MKKTSDSDKLFNIKDIILKEDDEGSNESENFISNSLDDDILLVDNINDEINNKKSNNKIKTKKIDNTANNTSDLSYYDDIDEEEDDYDYDDVLNDILGHGKQDYSSDNNEEENLDASDSLDDLKLLRAYIGKNYESIVNKRFNVFGFVFTFFYALYRKMYFLSFLFLICILGLIFIKNLIVILIIYILLSIGMGLFFNKIYIYFVKRKINKIKLKNNDLSFYELKDICSLKGGTDFRNVFNSILVIIVTCGSFFIFFNVSFNSLKDNIINLLSNIVNKNDDKNNKYKGFISYDNTINIKTKLSIDIPDIFVNESSNYNYDYKYYIEDDIFSKCRIKLASVLDYADSGELINQMIDYYEDNYEVDGYYEININDLDWTWFSYNNSLGIRYFYATVIDKKIYLFSYEIDSDDSIDYDSYRIQILESIKRK